MVRLESGLELGLGIAAK